MDCTLGAAKIKEHLLILLSCLVLKVTLNEIKINAKSLVFEKTVRGRFFKFDSYANLPKECLNPLRAKRVGR